MKHSSSETGAWTTRRSLALLGTVLFWIVVAIDIWYIWPSMLGGKTSFVVVSGPSMEPTYFGGDLVIARDIEPSVGDVIVYAPSELGGSQIVHRIIGGNGEDGWVLQGDNNSFIDPFQPTASEVKGVVLVHYSDLGRVTALMLNPIFWAAFLLAGLVLFVWFSGDDCDDDEDDEDDDATSDADPDADATLAEDAPAEDADGPEPVPAKGGRGGRAAAGVRASAFLAAATLALGFGISPAAAAQLTVLTPLQPQAFVMQACGNPSPAWGSTTTSTGTTSNQVTVSNIPAGCLNKAFTVTVHNASGTVLATLTGTPTSSSHSFTMVSGTYTVAQVSRVVVKVQGWAFPTTWTAPAPPASPATCVPTDAAGNPVAGTCTVTSITMHEQWGTPGTRGANVNFTVTSSTGHWRVTFNFSQAPFPGWSPHSVSGNFTLPPLSGCSSLPLVTLRSPSWSQYQAATYQYYMGIAEDSGNICA